MSDANPPAPDQPARRPIRKAWALAAVALAALAGSLVLYEMRGPADKEAAGDSACAAARSTAERMAPFARGAVAALAVEQRPQPLVAISFDAPHKHKRSLADFRGRTVLLNLWATWCIPCRREMPTLDRLQAKLGGKDFEVVAVNLDTARLDRRQAFLKQAGIKSLTFYADPSGEVFERLRQTGKLIGLPTTFILDPHGCTLGTMAGPAKWDSPDAVKLVRAAIGK